MGRSKEFSEEGEGAYCKQVRGGGCCVSSIWACLWPTLSLYCRYTKCHICLFWWIPTDCPFAVCFQALGWRKGVSLSYSGATSTFVQTLPICIKWGNGQSSVQGECKALHCLVDRLNSLRKLKVGLCAKKHTFQSWLVVPTSNNAKLQSSVDRERREDRRGRGCPIGWGCALALTLT